MFRGESRYNFLLDSFKMVRVLHGCFFSRRSEVHTEVDYSECEEATGSQCFRDTENAAEFTAEALRTQHFDSPVTVLSVESRSSDVTKIAKCPGCVIIVHAIQGRVQAANE